MVDTVDTTKAIISTQWLTLFASNQIRVDTLDINNDGWVDTELQYGDRSLFFSKYHLIESLDEISILAQIPGGIIIQF